MTGQGRACGNALAPEGTDRSWAVCLPTSQIASAGGLRLVLDIEVCQAADHVWLRGQRLEKGLEHRLRTLPGAARFWVLADGQLLPVGARVPHGWLPDGPWLSLARWLGIEMPRPCAAADPGPLVPLELQPSFEFVEPSVLLTSMGHWKTCADDCPQVRLDRWRFAVARDGRVVVVGQPLPSLPGERLVEHEGIAVSAGYFWSPPVEPCIVRERFALEAGDLALWHADGTWERIAAGDFVRATRAAIRATAEGLVHRGK